MRDLAVQAASDGVSSTERGYLDTEASKLATTIGAVIDQAQFNGTDLVADSSNTSKTVQSGADAGDTTALSFTAMTETILKVQDAMIDLSGTTSQAEVVNFKNISTQTTDGTGNGVYTLNLGGVEYTTGTVAAATDSTGMKTALDTATDNQGNLVTTVGTFGVVANELIFTYTRAGNQQDTFTISATHTGFDNANLVETTSDGNSQASDAISVIDDALAYVASERAALGATQAQLEATVRNLANVAENTAAATGRIMDTDYAAETANLTKAQILQQAATSILAQANAQPQAVLSLLQ
jgi:flagellin